MTDPEVMLRRQAQWQRDRCSLSWPEKIRMAEHVRESVERLRERTGPGRPLSPAPSGPTAARDGAMIPMEPPGDEASR